MITKVMCFVGCNTISDYDYEINKIKTISSFNYAPDMICDVSTFYGKIPLFEVIIKETCINAASVPIYITAQKNTRLSSSKVFNDIEYCIKSGVKMITLHLTPDVNLIQMSKNRYIPTTSRGGMIISKYGISNSKLGNIYSDILNDIIAISKENCVTLSIGSTFRGANIFDAMDDVNILEIRKQLAIAKSIKQQGCHVIIEGPGHISLNKLNQFADIINGNNINIMPLGPIISDNNLGADNIVASIGAVCLGLKVNIENIAAVSKKEHTGGIPSIDDTLEAITSARVAANIINMYRNANFIDDIEIIKLRMLNSSCTIEGKCTRCGNLCPLTTK